MREIKYKFWCLKNSVMYPAKSLKDIVDTMELDYTLIPLQFTGLKDKNGIEIYDGDILKHKDPKGYYSEKWEVIFYSGAFFMAGLPNKIRIYNVGDRLNTLEVIGNIHEHPHLISQPNTKTLN